MLIRAGFGARNETHPSVVGQVGPEPVEQDREPASHVHEEGDVHGAPQPLGGATTEAKTQEIGNGRFPSNRCHRAIVSIPE